MHTDRIPSPGTDVRGPAADVAGVARCAAVRARPCAMPVVCALAHTLCVSPCAHACGSWRKRASTRTCILMCVRVCVRARACELVGGYVSHRALASRSGSRPLSGAPSKYVAYSRSFGSLQITAVHERHRAENFGVTSGTKDRHAMRRGPVRKCHAHGMASALK